ncbi:MAG: L-lysine 6-transaminase [Nannocystaceae bacterium]|nr:L-lysine 6-transaminase [bacterium]
MSKFNTPADHVHSTLREWMLVDGMDVVYDTERSRGSRFVDARNGDEYIDLFSFFASMPLGHNHAGLEDTAFRERLLAAALVKPSNSDIYTEAMADFVATFGRTMPKGFDNLFFIEGGALAVENALKVAFDWKVRKNIEKGLISGDGDPDLGTKALHFRNAFHGRSGYTLSLTNGTSPNKTKYFPKFPWPRVTAPGARFPLTGDNLATTAAAEKATMAEIRDAIAANPNDIGALILEPIQGEGGDVHFRPEFLQALRTLCDEEEILLVFDEVQTGMGLTGKWWAFEHMGVQPDVFSFGKKAQVCGIAAGERVNEVDSCFKVSSRINSTWGGNLVDMVRCARYIDLIEKDDLLDNATSLGEHLLEVLRGIEGEFDQVSNSRGLGLMLAFDLPSAAARDALIKALWEAKTMVLPCGATSVRFRPFLDVSREDIDEAASRIRTALKAL